MKKIIEFLVILSILTIGSLTTAIAASHEKTEATIETAAKTAEAKTENTEKKKAAEEDEEPDCE